MQGGTTTTQQCKCTQDLQYKPLHDLHNKNKENTSPD